MQEHTEAAVRRLTRPGYHHTNTAADVLSANDISAAGLDSGYISEINGLAAYDGSDMSGWMGTLDAEFEPDEYEYTLTVPFGTTGVVVTPTASNKNYQVRTFDGSVTNYATASCYKRSEKVPVSDGSTIKVVCADPAWPTMNDTPVEPTVYTFTAAIAEEGDDPEEIVTDPVEISVKVNFSNGMRTVIFLLPGTY